MDITKIGKQIALLRKERGYTQEKLAELLNITPQAVSKWENGRALPETALLPKLAKTLDTSIDALLSNSRIQILSASYGDGLECRNVAGRLCKLVQEDVLKTAVNAAALGCSLENNRPKYLVVKYQSEEGVFYAFEEEGGQLVIEPGVNELLPEEQLRIVGASYGTAKARQDAMRKIEHFKVFDWQEYRANHELFPSDPNNDDTDYLTLVYLNQEGIHLVTCAEGESIAYTADRSSLFRKQTGGEYHIPNVPMLPEFGAGMECSWAAALTAALQAMGTKTDYVQVMGVSGACYRIAFCSPSWDYSSVDGLVAYDYATPGYRAFGYTPKFADRVEKENRRAERRLILDELRCNMPVLGINLRVAAEWGVICGYGDSGADLFCRTKYDREIIESPDYEKGKYNPYDYLFVDNWPFIIIHFSDRTAMPTEKENFVHSLKVLADCTKQEDNGGYRTGFAAYRIWKKDLLEEAWYQSCDEEQLDRRFSVNQFCTLALYDARRAAFSYLKRCRRLLPDREEEVEKLVQLYGTLSEKVGVIHNMLDSGEALTGEKTRRFWTKELREKQALLLTEMLEAEQEAVKLAETIIM